MKRYSILLIPLFVLLLLGAMEAWSQPKPAPVAPLSATPTAQPVETDDLLRDAVEGAVRTDSLYWTDGAHPSLLLKFVSSGGYGALDVPLEEGGVVQVNVVYAYTVNAVRQLLTVPVAVCAKFPGGATISLYTPSYGLPVENAACLTAAKQAFPRGRIFAATIFEFVRPDAVLWEQCPRYPYPAHKGICAVGEQLAFRFPNTEFELLDHIAEEIPTGWLLIGWALQAYTPDNATQWQVALP